VSNVRLHPYEGSHPFCDKCQLPARNAVHQSENTVHIMATFPDGTSEEWFTSEFTKDQLLNVITQLLTDAVVGDDVYNQPRCDTCNQAEEDGPWCGNCGNCSTHCVQYMDCPPRDKDTE